MIKVNSEAWSLPVRPPYVTCFLHPLIARVALVKCRDLHWAMMAHKDQRDTNLSSIRMLIVADGANPCESLLHKHSLFVMRNNYVQACFISTLF